MTLTLASIITTLIMLLSTVIYVITYVILKWYTKHIIKKLNDQLRKGGG